MNFEQFERYINPCHGMDLQLPVVLNQRDNENGILHYVQYLFLKDALGKITPQDIRTLRKIITNLRTYKSDGETQYKGLFDRGAKESLTIPPEQRRTISHDNLSAICAASRHFGLEFHKEIYEHGKRHKWRFDNRYPENPRFERTMRPSHVIYWSRLGGGKIGKFFAWCFMWFFYLTQLISCAKMNHVRPSLWQKVRAFFTDFEAPKHKTVAYARSGKLLAFVRLYPLLNRSWIAKLVWKLCKFLVKLHGKGGFGYVFTYFHDENHPVRVLGMKVFDENIL